MNFAVPDSAPAALVNKMVWKSVKGFKSEPPAAKTSGPSPDDHDSD